ncbi:MAG: hypothetical protein HBSAPP03_11200 [Phycisphaerae bacterium]|nr:MAG: hypothetical protein HBSAPP03_11200 [Phycisphaerae bacterium]
MDATPIPPTIPFRVAQAYGVRPAAAPASFPTHPDRVARVTAQDTVVLTAQSPEASAMRERVRPLVAAKVPQGVDFVAQGVASTPGTISMYRHPADKNAAATGVGAGRTLDVRG